MEAVTSDWNEHADHKITIHPTSKGVVGAYVDIVFDNCLKVEGIKVIKGPNRTKSEGGQRDIAFPVLR